ncbi:hypothetical protein [Sporosarcina quadrami]|uniref:hypothetical protein n=1 Tax=Sporosarcina quadrami TaxID=2762234 RepID=UPI00296B4A78|nr:hypothetical protein [Sporosarcina quadrami]
MPELNAEQLAGLERFSVFVNDRPNESISLNNILTDAGSTELLKMIHTEMGAPTDAVAASIYMRKYGFFIAAQLHMLSKFDLLWTGKLEEISLVTGEGNISFSIPSHSFRIVQDRESDIRFLLEQYGHPIVDYMSKRAHISKLILWENIWGYVIWMYSMLFQENNTSAQDDLAILLNDETWKPQLRRSPFQQFLQNEPILEAMANYKRTTCCLYKELPNIEKCPYCPLNRK